MNTLFQPSDEFLQRKCLDANMITMVFITKCILLITTREFRNVVEPVSYVLKYFHYIPACISHKQYIAVRYQVNRSPHIHFTSVSTSYCGNQTSMTWRAFLLELMTNAACQNVALAQADYEQILSCTVFNFSCHG